MQQSSGITILDLIIIIVYVFGMLSIGWYYNRRNKTQEDYMLGGRKMNPIAVGVSLFATLLSTLSYLAYPGEMIKHGPGIFLSLLAFPIIYFVAGWFVIPRIRRLNATSVYEILEVKLGPKVRTLATIMFLLIRFFWMATIVYVTVDIALVSVIEIDESYIPWISFGMLAVTIIYTVLGGLRAVVMTDVVQICVFLGGAVLSVLVVVYQLGSFSALIPDQWPDHWTMPKIGFDPSERVTLGNAVLMSFLWYISTICSDQMAFQRYVSTKDLKSSRQSLKVSLISDMLSKCILAMVGLAMVAYFTHFPGMAKPDQSLTQQADELFPVFILRGLPMGVTGVLVAGLLAAAMSSLSSGLNAVSSVILDDLVNRKKEMTTGSLRQAKQLTMFVGLAVLVVSMLIGYIPGNLYDVIVKVVNLFVVPLFVLFFLALFVPVATEWGTFIGGLFAVAIAIAIGHFGFMGISILWIGPSALLVGVTTGVFFSLVDRMIAYYKGRVNG